MLKGLAGKAGRPVYTLNLMTSQRNVDVRAALSNPAVAGDVTVIVAAGVIIGTTGSVALRFNTGWPAGCNFALNNAGTIIGQGGDGGTGGGVMSAGSAGGNGSNAIWCDGNAITCANTGYILGGTGGGGGGGGDRGASGGGGGGGRGDEQGYGGNSGGGEADNGYDGSVASSGAGGQGETNVSLRGGNGGMGGQPGETRYFAGGAAGANGAAIVLGGGSFTFTTGGSPPNYYA